MREEKEKETGKGKGKGKRDCLANDGSATLLNSKEAKTSPVQRVVQSWKQRLSSNRGMHLARAPQYRAITQALRTQQLPFFQSTLPALFVIEARQSGIGRRRAKRTR